MARNVSGSSAAFNGDVNSCEGLSFCGGIFFLVLVTRKLDIFIAECHETPRNGLNPVCVLAEWLRPDRRHPLKKSRDEVRGLARESAAGAR